jgi:hypothetical protein
MVPVWVYPWIAGLVWGFSWSFLRLLDDYYAIHAYDIETRLLCQDFTW